MITGKREPEEQWLGLGLGLGLFHHVLYFSCFFCFVIFCLCC